MTGIVSGSPRWSWKGRRSDDVRSCRIGEFVIRSRVRYRAGLALVLLIGVGGILLAAGSNEVLMFPVLASGGELAANFGWLSTQTIVTIVNYATSWWGQGLLAAFLIGVGLAGLAGAIIYIAARYGAVYLAAW